MTTNTEQQSVCSVSQLAKKLRLSRARFYQLQHTGIFPPPVYCLYTKRPLYTERLQEQCLEIRRTGIGRNGRPIIFYSKRDATAIKSHRCSEQKCRELSDALEQTGLKISPAKAGKAFMAIFPDDWKKLDINGAVIAKVFRYFQNGV